MSKENPYRTDEEDRKAAEGMDKIVKTTFAPIYPLIASQITAKHNITKGNCIDIGSGPAALSIALAEITDLQISAVDISKYSFEFAKKNISEKALENQITPVKAPVEDLPFEDNSADLIVSRGSVFFWNDQKKAFNEIYRILKPGGKTHIGGGFGSSELKKAIFEEMAKKDDGFEKKVKNRMSPENQKKIRDALEASDIGDYVIDQGDQGFWIHIEKE